MSEGFNKYVLFYAIGVQPAARQVVLYDPRLHFVKCIYIAYAVKIAQ
jgi:hypothetical protein